MLSYLGLVQLASESSECEARPYCGTQVHAPMAAVLCVPQGIKIVQEWTGPMTMGKVYSPKIEQRGKGFKTSLYFVLSMEIYHHRKEWSYNKGSNVWWLVLQMFWTVHIFNESNMDTLQYWFISTINSYTLQWIWQVNMHLCWCTDTAPVAHWFVGVSRVPISLV